MGTGECFMTSKDKTGDKLVASMRKSKTGTVTQKTSERSASAGSTTAADKPARKKAEPAPKQGGCFSHGRRVWPD
jgi:hypothetical protein